MYIFFIVSSIYICFLFSFIPMIYRESKKPSKTLEQLHRDYKEEVESEDSNKNSQEDVNKESKEDEEKGQNGLDEEKENSDLGEGKDNNSSEN